MAYDAGLAGVLHLHSRGSSREDVGMSAITDWLEYATKEDAERMAAAARWCRQNLYATTTYCNDEQGAQQAIEKIMSSLDSLAEKAEKEASK